MNTIIMLVATMVGVAFDFLYILALVVGFFCYKNMYISAFCGAIVGVLVSFIIFLLISGRGDSYTGYLFIAHVLDGALWAILVSFLRRSYREIPPSQETQAEVPQDTRLIEPATNRTRDKNTNRSSTDELEDVDGINIKPFSKTSRIIGLSLIVIFVAWGLFYEWGDGRNRLAPFEMFMRELGVWNSTSRELFSLYIAGIILFVGFYFRFFIGSLMLYIALMAMKVAKMIYTKI